jgi:hypothetical protein
MLLLARAAHNRHLSGIATFDTAHFVDLERRDNSQ